MWYLQLGWVGCWSIYFCDDSPFAYTLVWAANTSRHFFFFFFFFFFFLAWRGVAWHGERILATVKKGGSIYSWTNMVHIHSVMITYSDCLGSNCIAVGGRAIGSESLCR